MLGFFWLMIPQPTTDNAAGKWTLLWIVIGLVGCLTYGSHAFKQMERYGLLEPITLYLSGITFGIVMVCWFMACLPNLINKNRNNKR